MENRGLNEGDNGQHFSIVLTGTTFSVDFDPCNFRKNLLCHMASNCAICIYKAPDGRCIVSVDSVSVGHEFAVTLHI
ncbi:hypothetical protein MAR_023277 [Mya arenaria]|uniref:Uncharacterized protein n=1 Tax=Mya arenaria TaxID=6604 RepID=A0ABY7DNG7_MYAAR|nr:hypothetical protein MAR_023277 [Mya arenaria]